MSEELARKIVQNPGKLYSPIKKFKLPRPWKIFLQIRLFIRITMHAVVAHKIVPHPVRLYSLIQKFKLRKEG